MPPNSMVLFVRTKYCQSISKPLSKRVPNVLFLGRVQALPKMASEEPVSQVLCGGGSEGLRRMV